MAVRVGDEVLNRLHGGLVVSCQADPGHPLAAPDRIAALARCAEAGGAVAVRIEGTANVRAVAAATSLPIIGIAKVRQGTGRPFITPTYEHCEALVAAGAHLVAVEATPDYRPDPQDFAMICERVHTELGVPVMADVSTTAEGALAWEAGADLVGTTLSGYTTTSRPRTTPDIEMVRELSARGIRAVLEGFVSHPDEVAEAFAAGAWAVVVGKAITAPEFLTERFAAVAPATSGRDVATLADAGFSSTDRGLASPDGFPGRGLAPAD